MVALTDNSLQMSSAVKQVTVKWMMNWSDRLPWWWQQRPRPLSVWNDMEVTCSFIDSDRLPEELVYGLTPLDISHLDGAFSLILNRKNNDIVNEMAKFSNWMIVNYRTFAAAIIFPPRNWTQRCVVWRTLALLFPANQRNVKFHGRRYECKNTILRLSRFPFEFDRVWAFFLCTFFFLSLLRLVFLPFRVFLSRSHCISEKFSIRQLKKTSCPPISNHSNSILTRTDQIHCYLTSLISNTFFLE